MTYQDTLRNQLQRRIEMNPRYSLRAFADFLQLQPSKLSEILNGKRGLSVEKAQLIGRRLKLESAELEAFVLSAEAQHSRFQSRRTEASLLLEKLERQSFQMTAKTEQKCAWYYGAVEACLEHAPAEVGAIATKLGITSLQVENAKRYLARRAKNWPEKKQLRIEESNLLQKVQAAYVQGAGHLEADAYFIHLSLAEKRELQSQIQALMSDFKKRAQRSGKTDRSAKGVPSVSDDAPVQMININFISF